MEPVIREPRPGMLKIVSTTIEPLSTLMNIGTMTLHSGMNELRSAWRTVACSCVSPFARASSMYSELSASNSSARM